MVALLGLALSVGIVPVGHSGPAQAAFPGRNGFIVFPVRQCPCVDPFAPLAPDYDLFLLNPGSRTVEQVNEGSDLDTEFDIQPAWSPDGRFIAFTRGSEGATQSDIYVTEVASGETVNLTNSPLTVDFGPAFSPDGRKIAFNSDAASPELLARALRTEPEGDLYVMDADGSNVVQLTSGLGGQIAPAWSPDGNWIAFRDVPTADVAPERLGLIRPDGSGMRFLPPYPWGVSNPQWSPDGKRILFNGTGSDADIWVINADGSQPRNLTDDSQARDIGAVWSPDGEYIAFLSNRDSGFRLYRMRPDGSQVTELIDLELQSDTSPDWGPRP